MRSVREGDQELPHAGQQDVGPEVVQNVLGQVAFYSPALVESVVSDFRARIQLGIERYGHPLQTHNGRDALVDAYQELLDAAHYLMQARMEGNSKAWLAYSCIIGVVFDVKELMKKGE